MHCVTFVPGEQGRVDRCSFAYLVWLDSDVLMKRLVGGDSLIPGLEEGEEDNASRRGSGRCRTL
jgi:hypothetical protein